MLTLMMLLALTGAGGAGDPGVVAYTRVDPTNYESITATDVWRLRADGSERVLLARGAREPAWSSDGRRLAVVRDEINPANGYHYSAIWTMDADGGNQRQLTPVGSSYLHPAWSPDGRSLAVATYQGLHARQIITMSADGSFGPDTMFAPVVQAWPVRSNQRAGLGAPAWSPDGESIAYTRKVEYEPVKMAEETTPIDESAIYVARKDGSDERQLTADGALASSPAWSPDGSRIAYLSRRDRNGHGGRGGSAEVYVMRADGGDQVRLTRTRAEESRPAWSDEDTIVFAQKDPVGEPGLDGAGTVVAQHSRLVTMTLAAGCSTSFAATAERAEFLSSVAWQPGSGTSRRPCDSPLPPAQATFAGIAPSAVTAEISGGRAVERALVRRLVAGTGADTTIRAVRIARPPVGVRRRAPGSIWLRFELAGGRRQISAVRANWEAGLVADAYARASVAAQPFEVSLPGPNLRPLLGHTTRFAGGRKIAFSQRWRQANPLYLNASLAPSLIASEVAAARLPAGVRLTSLRFVRHYDRSAARLVLRIDDPTSFAGFGQLYAATLGRLELDQGAMVEFRDRCGRLVAALAPRIYGVAGEIRVAPGWSCPPQPDSALRTTCPARRPSVVC